MHWYNVYHSRMNKSTWDTVSHELPLRDLLAYIETNKFIIFENEVYYKNGRVRSIRQWDGQRKGSIALRTDSIMEIHELVELVIGQTCEGKGYEEPALFQLHIPSKFLGYVRTGVLQEKFGPMRVSLTKKLSKQIPGILLSEGEELSENEVSFLLRGKEKRKCTVNSTDHLDAIVAFTEECILSYHECIDLPAEETAPSDSVESLESSGSNGQK